ncbi:MAG: hypothetical protein CMQ24_03670 [Gammaproteobacteria bacterium]|nr:hypothetical protein [Gammaproteobacteria bacterium]
MLRLVSRPLALAAAFALGFLPPAASAGERIGDFALIDHRGQHHQLSYYSDQKAVVLAAHGIDEAAGFEAPGGVTFLYINALQTEGRSRLTDVTPEASAPILVDESQMVSASLGLNRVGDMLIVNPASMQTRYRGNVSELRDVLPAVLSGAEGPVMGQPGNGRAITSAAFEPVSYTNDIAPMLAEHCAGCHHEGGIAPWAMTNHAMIKGWSAMIREVVQTRRMPPGQIDTHVGKPILDVAGLTPDEHRTLLRWIDAGAPSDVNTETPDPLTGLEYDTKRFSLGEPDLVYTVPVQEIPATGVIDYRYVPVPLKLDRDVWVRAMEFIPGDRQVLHHVIAYVSTPSDRSMRGIQTGVARGESVGGFAPGRQPDQFRDNSGRLIRKGSSLLLQMHYTTTGRATTDETEIGIYLHDAPPQHVMSGGVAGQRRFMVPPHAREHKLEGVQEIARDAWLYELNPHMHFRGKYMNYSVEYPDGRSEMVLSVPKYDFNWQFNYVLADPLFLPAGSKIIARGAMDNSAQNPGNPDPSTPVHFGLQTKHEMFFGFTTLRYVGDKPPALVAR